jgi:hypothetical protein
VLFLSCKADARVKLAKTGHGPHSSTLIVIFVLWLLFMLFCVLFVCNCVLPPGDNPTAVNKYIYIIISYIICIRNCRAFSYDIKPHVLSFICWKIALIAQDYKILVNWYDN